MSELMTRAAEIRPSSIDEANRTVDVIWSTGARVARYGGPLSGRWSEELDMNGAKLERLNGGANLLDSHQAGSVRNILGKVERAWVENGMGLATVRFSTRPDVEGLWQDVRSGIISSISVGYRIHRIDRVPRQGDGGVDLGRVVEWTPTELSFVSAPADLGARVRAEEIEVRESGAASSHDRLQLWKWKADHRRRFA